jgi:hypothetical protein
MVRRLVLRAPRGESTPTRNIVLLSLLCGVRLATRCHFSRCDCPALGAVRRTASRTLDMCFVHGRRLRDIYGRQTKRKCDQFLQANDFQGIIFVTSFRQRRREKGTWRFRKMHRRPPLGQIDFGTPL